MIVLVGSLALVGWATNSVTLRSLSPTLPPMPPNAAAGLILGGAALWLLSGRRLHRANGIIGNTSAALIALLGLGTLVEHIFDLRSGIDAVLFRTALEAAHVSGRLAISTGLGFLLSGIALLCLHTETRRGNRPAQYLAICVAMMCLLTLLSYGYSTAPLYHLIPGMAIHTCAAFLLLAVGILSAYPRQGLMVLATGATASGFMLRRLLLAGIGIPSILGWLTVAGVSAKLYSGEFGVALLVAANVVLFLIVIWRNAQLMHRIDTDRQRAANALQESKAELELRVEARTVELTAANEALLIEVAERCRVGEEMRRSQERFANFFENAAVGLHWVAPDGLILQVNRAELDMLGYRREEYVGHDIAEFHADPEIKDELLKHLAQGQTLVDYPAKLRAKDGSIRQVLINSNVLGAGDRFIHTGCFTRDITEAKHLEDERNQLLLSEQTARSQAEDATETIRRLQTVTDTALSHLGLDDLLREILVRIQDLLGADASAILLISEDEKYLAGRIAIGLEEEARVRVPMGRGIAGRIAITRQPLIVDDLSKTEVVSSILLEKVSSLVGVPLMIEDRVIGVIHVDTLESHCFTADDVRLLQLAADRVAMAIDRARLFEGEQRARLEAETANRMKDDFLATISHELRSPLNSILGWVTLLRDGNLSEEAKASALKTVERSARAQNRIISDLVDVSSILKSKLHLNMRSLEPGPTIEAGVEAVRPDANVKRIPIIMALDAEAGAIIGDSDRLQQIVRNLMSNAIKFTPEGGTVEVRLERNGSHIELTVSDTGTGISPEFLPYAFDRFRQADNSSTRKKGGLGLGLAIVRHLVELHGGTVRAESEGAGKGALFVVRLPLANVTGNTNGARTHAWTAQTAIPLDCPPPLEGLRVLVVDEETNVRELVSDILINCDADVRTAASAAEALTIFGDGSRWRPDVLIADVEMPESNGYELMRQIRSLSLEHGGRVPAVALTAHTRVEDRLRAHAAGFQMLVLKPVEPAELLTVLGSVSGRLPRSTGPLAPL
jgi:PAS domain S-box-containing protein